jgi:hypothetical protein
MLADYQLNGRRSLRSARLSVTHLRKFFGFDRAIGITTDRIKAYAADRQKAKAANASINRELAALKRIFSLALHDGRLSSTPYIPTLEEDDARQGFCGPRRIHFSQSESGRVFAGSYCFVRAGIGIVSR